MRGLFICCHAVDCHCCHPMLLHCCVCVFVCESALVVCVFVCGDDRVCCRMSPPHDPAVPPPASLNLQRSYSSRQPSRGRNRVSLPPIDDITDPLRPGYSLNLQCPHTCTQLVRVCSGTRKKWSALGAVFLGRYPANTGR